MFEKFLSPVRQVEVGVTDFLRTWSCPRVSCKHLSYCVLHSLTFLPIYFLFNFRLLRITRSGVCTLQIVFV